MPKVFNEGSAEPKRDTSGHFIINESQVIVENLSNCLKTGTLCDIVLVVGDQEIPCHRFVLCASSPVFTVMLSNDCWKEFSSQRVKLHEPEECIPVFYQFIQFMYCGKVDVPLDKVLAILFLADKYNVWKLTKSACDFLHQNMIEGIKQRCIFDWMNYAKRRGDLVWYNQLSQFVRFNFETVATHTNWIDVDEETFCSLINQSDLVVSNEYALFTIAQSWLMEHFKVITDDTEMERIAVSVLSCIRYPMMSPRQLASLAISKYAHKYYEFVMKRMAIGMSFHYGNLTNELLDSETNGVLQIYPRIYTEDALSSPITVDRFKKCAAYSKSTLVFSTSTSLAECDGERPYEWVIELWPKGVRIERGLLISYNGNVVVPGNLWNWNRLSITCRDPPAVPGNHLRVRICVLLYGIQNGETCVIGFKEQVHRFDEENPIVHMNGILPFDVDKVLNGYQDSNETYLVGANRDQIQMHLVIAPLPVLET